MMTSRPKDEATTWPFKNGNAQALRFGVSTACFGKQLLVWYNRRIQLFPTFEQFDINWYIQTLVLHLMRVQDLAQKIWHTTQFTRGIEGQSSIKLPSPFSCECIEISLPVEIRKVQ